MTEPQAQEEPPKRAAFHKHLDDHQHCRDNPMRLCPVGAQLLSEAADEAAVLLRQKHGGLP